RRTRVRRRTRVPSMPKLRLNKVLAQAGLTSRRGAERFITEGRVAVNGVVTRELATLADPDVDVVTVDGRVLPRSEALRYLLLHKPRGYRSEEHTSELQSRENLGC